MRSRLARVTRSPRGDFGGLWISGRALRAVWISGRRLLAVWITR
jgi:hypothetical protein